MSVINRLQVVVDYIEDNLDTRLSLELLANKAAMSKFHFARAFKGLFGMTPMDAVKRYRIKRAGNQLAFRDLLSITDIALQAGYQNSESFSRAFTQLLGCTPSEFRQSADASLLQALLTPLNDWKKNMATQQDYQVDIVQLETVTVAELLHIGPPNQLGASIQQFIAWRKANHLPPTKSRTFNFVYDDPQQTAAEHYRFGLGCEIQQASAVTLGNLKEKHIPAGRYARIIHQGSDTVLESLTNYLYAVWLPQSAETPADFPLFFERVHFYPDVPESEVITHIYLPLR